MGVSDCTNTDVFTVREEKRERLGEQKRKKEEASGGDERRGKRRGQGRGGETQERKRDVERRGKGKGSEERKDSK